MHRELLRLATDLAENDKGYPRWVARNRAISTAYYALFHALAERCARDLVGAWRPWPPFRHVYRSLDHGHARRIFLNMKGDRSFSEDARTIADVFLDLQERRHGADYDIGYRASGIEVSGILAQAARAVGLLDVLEATERTLISARLIGRTRS